MKTLVVGLGSIGRRHLHNLCSLDDQEAVLVRSGKSTLPDDDLAGFPTESDLAQALDRHRPDAVIVSNPTALHLPVALAAAEAGCHLFLEKPVSHRLDGVEKLAHVVAAKSVCVFVGFQFRFHPGLRAVRDWLVQGAIGRVLHASVHWGEYLPGWHPWENHREGYAARADLGGGVVLTLCHPLDYLRWLVGEVKTVTATTATASEVGDDVESIADIGLIFDNGAIGHVHLDYVQRPPSHTLRIIGSNGTILWDNQDGVARMQVVGKAEERIPLPPGFERNVMFVDEMRHFIHCVRNNETPRVTLRDGVAALEIAVAAKESAANGHQVEL